MPTAILPDGTRTRNCAMGFDGNSQDGPGYLQWGGARTDRGRPQYQIRFTSMSEEQGEDGLVYHFDFVGQPTIIGYDSGKPLASLLPENAKYYYSFDDLLKRRA